MIIYQKAGCRFNISEEEDIATDQTIRLETFIVDGIHDQVKLWAEKPPHTVVDIGAHIGALSIFMCKFGSSKLHAFEPDPDNYRLLCRNIIENHMEANITPYHMGVSGASGMKKLREAETTDGVRNTGQRSFKYHPTFKVVDVVPVIDLKTVIQWSGPADYLKCDTEGSEYDIFDTDQETLRKIDYLDLDIHLFDDEAYFPKQEPRIEKLYSTLEKAGFLISEQTKIKKHVEEWRR